MVVRAAIHHPAYFRPPLDPAISRDRADAMELLDRRSKNISYIMSQQANPYAATGFAVPPADQRAEALHKQLGVDKAVLVSSPLQIDTTAFGVVGRSAEVPMAAYKPPSAATNTVPISSDGVEGVGEVNGIRLRGGWPVK
jgi:hypothetical protein